MFIISYNTLENCQLLLPLLRMKYKKNRVRLIFVQIVLNMFYYCSIFVPRKHNF